MSTRKLGVMLDCSRNAVMRPEKVKEFAAMIAGMGYNMLQLYTEDTYTIEEEPFFGYMRGKYTKEELRDIDAYCASIGVELVPCIQVLAHLSRITHWEEYIPHTDCFDILLVGDPRVYELIDHMFKAISDCFTSRKVNVGMDEAMLLGLGKYMHLHGYTNRIDIMAEHLDKVKEIADKYGFTIMMWSDMFFRICNNNEYYVEEGPVVTEEMIASVPKGVELIYWDYYGRDKKHYDVHFEAHQKFHNPLGFAGGIFTWFGFVPNLKFTLTTAEAAMRSQLEHPVDTVLFTLWGDGGKECSYFSTLPVLFAAAEFYRGNFDRQDIAVRFKEYTGYDFDMFMALELPNETGEENTPYHNPSKYLLYNDPFLGLYDFTVADDMPERYRKATETLEQWSEGHPYSYLFAFEAKLSKVLERKCDLGIRIRNAYTGKDMDSLRWIAAEEIPMLRSQVEELYEALRTVWFTENKAFGFEVLEGRFGTILLRLQSCAKRMLAYVNGEISEIEELEEKQLVIVKGYEKKAVVFNRFEETMTTGVWA